MSATIRSHEVPLTQVRIDFYVRKTMDSDRVTFFEDLYRSSADVPALEINPDKVLIDGRHRLEALKRLKRRYATCVIVQQKDRAEMIALAIARNANGALPPSEEDYIFSAVQLLQLGKIRADVVRMLAKLLPVSMATRLVANAQSNLAKQKTRAALRDVSDNDMTVAAAAKKHKIEPARLKAALRGRSKTVVNSSSLAAITTTLTKRFRGLSASNANLLKRLAERCEDGELNERVYASVVTKMRVLVAKLSRVVDDYDHRFKTQQRRSAKRVA